jgi:hypothetical protein
MEISSTKRTKCRSLNHRRVNELSITFADSMEILSLEDIIDYRLNDFPKDIFDISNKHYGHIVSAVKMIECTKDNEEALN